MGGEVEEDEGGKAAQEGEQAVQEMLRLRVPVKSECDRIGCCWLGTRQMKAA